LQNLARQFDDTSSILLVAVGRRLLEKNKEKAIAESDSSQNRIAVDFLVVARGLQRQVCFKKVFIYRWRLKQ